MANVIFVLQVIIEDNAFRTSKMEVFKLSVLNYVKDYLSSPNGCLAGLVRWPQYYYSDPRFHFLWERISGRDKKINPLPAARPKDERKV